MSWTSPFTVARITLPRFAVSAFSMNCSRWLTAAFMASADCSTSATISSLALNKRPTSAMPSISGPLIMSSGAVPSARLRSRSSTSPSLRAFDDVVRQALIERLIFLLDLFFLGGGAEMFRDGRDMKLVDRGLLLFALLAPVCGKVAQQSGLRMASGISFGAC